MWQYLGDVNSCGSSLTTFSLLLSLSSLYKVVYLSCIKLQHVFLECTIKSSNKNDLPDIWSAVLTVSSGLDMYLCKTQKEEKNKHDVRNDVTYGQLPEVPLSGMCDGLSFTE